MKHEQHEQKPGALSVLSTPLPPAIFSIAVRIYYEDTDAGGVVYYANYLKFLERCRTEWLRSIGIGQAELLHDAGIAFVVRSVNIEYLKPARLDDLLTVSLAIERVSRSQIFFVQHIRRAGSQQERGDDLIQARVQIVSVGIDPTSGQMKVSAIPASLRTQLETLR